MVDFFEGGWHSDGVPPTKTSNSGIYRTADRMVGGLPAYLTRLRSEGESYGRIAQFLQDQGIVVTAQTVQNWCRRIEAQAS